MADAGSNITFCGFFGFSPGTGETPWLSLLSLKLGYP